MSRNVRTYDHFCLVARALEQLGDRWSLLVVRDLLSGRKRFTDLMARLGGITPKTLSLRLRELEASGILVADREHGRREVWYSLTDVGYELEPVIDSLGLWGLHHAWRKPLPGEPLHAEHLLRAAVQAIDVAADDDAPAQWRFILDGEDYFVASDGRHWSYGSAPKAASTDVTLIAGADAFTRFITSGSDDGVEIDGDIHAVNRLRRLISTISTVVSRA